MADTSPSFQEIREMFREAAIRAQEAAIRSKELDRQLLEMSQEADRRKQELDRQLLEISQNADRRLEKLEKTVEKVSKNVGGLNRSMGELIETLIAAHLWEKFAEYNYNLDRAYQRINIYDDKKQVITDIDILLADTEWVMAVEVKREADDIRDVDHHIKRMSLIRKYPPAEAVGKKLLGAIAAGVVSADIRQYAYQNGFFVLELTGESVALIPPPSHFSPKIW
jgi:paraquat-inducible protein B